MESEESFKKYIDKCWENKDWIPLIIFGALIFGIDKIPENIGSKANEHKTE